MSNLKKILALVLALVMSFSLVTVSSAAFEDVDDVNAKYEEAIAVLSGLKVFNGRTATEFAPKANITRAEVAAIIYRVVTGDVAGKQVGIYADYNKFDDVDSAAWYAGYVNYCANAEYVKGVNATEFQPDANVTGYQVLAMILRAVGYDKAGEFTGPNWDIQTAAVAKKLGVTKNVNDITLSTYVSREVVAELLFRAINVPQVTYTLALGYNDKDAIVGGEENPTLGYETFYLTYDETVRHDEWGRPYHIWFKDAVKHDKVFNDGTSNIVCFLDYVPVASYNTAVSECDVAADLGLSSDKTVALLTVNGVDALGACNAFNGTINRVTKDKMGAQGRLTEIYYTDAGVYEVVMIDEFLAKVEKVTEAEFDKNGHLTDYAELVLTVYDGSKTTKNLTIESKTDWTWNVGDYLIINAKCDDDSTTSYVEDNTYANEVYNIVGAAEFMVGGQTAFTTKASHIVEGVEYPDAVRFHKDDAVDSMADHTWFFDTNGNMIGNAVIDTVFAFGTITAIKWVDSNADLSNGYALATITYVDGTQTTEKIYSINGITLTGVEGLLSNYATGDVSSTKQYNEAYKLDGVTVTTGDFTNVAMYSMTQDAYGRGLVLRETEELENPSVETGVPTIASNMKAGNATMFLVWNASTGKYETYTGIKNVPSYVAAYGYFWGFDKNEDNVAEYVFISESRLTAATSLDTYFIYEADLEYTTVLDPTEGEYYYIISGGFVNGEAADLYVGTKAAVEVIKANAGKLLLIETTNGFLSAYQVVTDAASYVKNIPGYVVYAGAAYVDDNADGKNDNILSVVNGQNVLIIDGEAYDIEGTPVITNVKGLNKVMDKNLGAYVYVVYTKGVNNEKAAKLIYITDVAGTTAPAPVECEIEAAIAALTEKVEELKALIAELKEALELAEAAETTGNAYVDAYNEIQKLEAELADAVDALTAAIEAHTEECKVDHEDDLEDVEDLVEETVEQVVEAEELIVVEAVKEILENVVEADDADEYIAENYEEILLVNDMVEASEVDVTEIENDGTFFDAVVTKAEEDEEDAGEAEDFEAAVTAAKAAAKALYEQYKSDEDVKAAYQDLMTEINGYDELSDVTAIYDAEKDELKDSGKAGVLLAAVDAAEAKVAVAAAVAALEADLLAAVKAVENFDLVAETATDDAIKTNQASNLTTWKGTLEAATTMTAFESAKASVESAIASAATAYVTGLLDGKVAELKTAAVAALADAFWAAAQDADDAVYITLTEDAFQAAATTKIGQYTTAINAAEVNTYAKLMTVLDEQAETVVTDAATIVTGMLDELGTAKKTGVTNIKATFTNKTDFSTAEQAAVNAVIDAEVAKVMAATTDVAATAAATAGIAAVQAEIVAINVTRIGTSITVTANNQSTVDAAIGLLKTSNVTVTYTQTASDAGTIVVTFTGSSPAVKSETITLTVNVVPAA